MFDRDVRGKLADGRVGAIQDERRVERSLRDVDPPGVDAERFGGRPDVDAGGL